MIKSKTDRRSTPVDQPLDSEVISFREQFDDRSPLDELVREGARRMLQEAINALISLCPNQMSSDKAGDFVPILCHTVVRAADSGG